MGDPPIKDLVVLAADKDIEFAVRGILSRITSLGIRPVIADIFVNHRHDPDCFKRGHEFLRSQSGSYKHAVVMFDREGSGREEKTREEIEREVEERLSGSGWGDRAAAIVIDPELEAWVWSDSPEVDGILGWEGRKPGLRKALGIRIGEKPAAPKEAMERALREARKARSSAIYEHLARKVGFERCEDPAFAKLKSVLLKWFPGETP